MHEHGHHHPDSGHSHSHGHSHIHEQSHIHEHSHSHHHNIDEQRISWAFWLNFSFTIIEFIGGWLTNSVAIMADAVHDLGDSLSIGLAWYLSKVGKRGATKQYSYGFKRLSLLGTLVKLMPDWQLGERNVSLLYYRDQRMTPRVRSFIDFAISEFRP